MRNPTDTAQANNSGIPTLQPMGFGEILDITFSLYRKYFLLFLAIVIIHFFGKLVEYSLENFLSNFPLKNLIVSSVSEPAMFVSMGGIIIATATTYLGKQTTSSAVLRATLQRFFTMLGGYILWVLCFIIPLISLGFFVSRVERGNFSILLLAVLLIGLPVPTYFAVRWLFVVKAILIEKLLVGASLKRSSELVCGSWWRVCSISVSFLILSGAISIIFKASVACLLVLTNVADQAGFMDIIRWAIMEDTIDKSNLRFYTIMMGTHFVVSTLTFPIWVIGNTLLYFDLRVRKEGFDIEIQVDSSTAREPEPTGP